jgi:hypothetical protein
VGEVNLLDIMEAVASVEQSVSISTPLSLSTRKVHVASPPPSQAISSYPTFLNVYEQQDTEAGVDMRVTRGTIRVQCLLALAEPGDEKIQAAAIAFWQATYDALCGAVTLLEKASVAMRVGGSEVPAFLERGNQRYIGFEISLAVNVTEAFAWAA